jgi:adenylate cyclase
MLLPFRLKTQSKEHDPLTFAMLKSRSKFFLHAKVGRTGAEDEGFDDAQAGHPIERRLNRLERVSAAYRGQINLRFNNGMLVTFESADAALLGACEMQHRCAVLPQVSRQKLALCVGIHQGVVKQREKDGADDARELAAQLAQTKDGILISQAMLDGLNQDLRKLARPFPEKVSETTVFTIDWRREIPSGAYGGESFWPTSMHSLPITPFLYLHFGLKTLEISEISPAATIGRDPESDLVLSDVHVSRYHCRIERRLTGIVLTDQSTNGTTIVSDDGTELLVKNGSAPLKGKGLLFFGRPFKGERRGGVRFEAF